MTTIETTIENVIANLENEILTPRPEEPQIFRFKKILSALRRESPRLTEELLRKELWMGFAINLLPQSVTDQMEFHREEGYILSIEDGFRTYQFQSSEISI